jgi:hypothetical protein
MEHEISFHTAQLVARSAQLVDQSLGEILV